MIDIFTYSAYPFYLIWPFIGGITAGFPSLADDHLDSNIDLNIELIKERPSSFRRVQGDSMTGAGMDNGVF